MKLPIIRGIIDRRLLVNWRVSPDALARLLPPPFKPKLTSDGRYGVAGICLIRLRELRPRGLPSMLGVSSENAAHRIAVRWTDPETQVEREGVYIPRRDSSSRLNQLAGGRLFPGFHHHAHFEIDEAGDRFSVAMTSDDNHTRVSVCGTVTRMLPAGSVFKSLGEASAFFEAGSLGYSPTHSPGEFEGLELKTDHWAIDALDVERAESSFFADPEHFAPGTATFDCALLMRNIDHEWHDAGRLAGSLVGAT